MIYELWQAWTGFNWANEDEWTYIYDGNNNLVECIKVHWMGSTVEDIYKSTYTYNGNNNLIEELVETWYGSNWVNYSKYTYAYIITGIEPFAENIKTYNLSYNYPNPFNPKTTINYSVPKISFITIKVFDVLGKEITTLVNEEKPNGSYEVEFNAISAAGGLPSGVYFYRLQAGNYTDTKKMVLLR